MSCGKYWRQRFKTSTCLVPIMIREPGTNKDPPSEYWGKLRTQRRQWWIHIARYGLKITLALSLEKLPLTQRSGVRNLQALRRDIFTATSYHVTFQDNTRVQFLNMCHWLRRSVTKQQPYSKLLLTLQVIWFQKACEIQFLFAEKGEERKVLAVCFKGLTLLKDKSIELMEWLEILLTLGAEKITLYNLGLHENIAKVGLFICY